jgi:hypothetical protein
MIVLVLAGKKMKEPTLRTFSRHKFVPFLPKHNQAPTYARSIFKAGFCPHGSLSKSPGGCLSTSIFCERFNGCMDEWICRVVPVCTPRRWLLVNTVELLILVSRFYRRTALFVSLIERKVSSIKSADAEQLAPFSVQYATV